MPTTREREADRRVAEAHDLLRAFAEDRAWADELRVALEAAVALLDEPDLRARVARRVRAWQDGRQDG